MTSYYGHAKVESVRRRDTHPGAPGSFAARRELPPGACARPGSTAVRRSEGTAEPRARRHRGRALHGTDPCVPAGSAVFRSRRPEAVPAPAHRTRNRPSKTGRGTAPPPSANGQAPVRVSERSSLGAVAASVAGALRARGIRAVLTGGACAALYSEGAYHSRDLDFIVVEDVTRAEMDNAMESVGFTRRRDRYVHPRARFYVEFPRGPLAIGGEYRIRPVSRSTLHGPVLMLSATDSCRDRLAAFYHWGDRQSLTIAAWIAARNRVNLATLQRWSAAEGAREGFEQFVAETSGIRRRMAPRRPRR